MQPRHWIGLKVCSLREEDHRAPGVSSFARLLSSWFLVHSIATHHFIRVTKLDGPYLVYVLLYAHYNTRICEVWNLFNEQFLEWCAMWN